MGRRRENGEETRRGEVWSAGYGWAVGNEAKAHWGENTVEGASGGEG